MMNYPAEALAPYKLKEGKVSDMPDHELWIRGGDNVHQTATDIIKDLVDAKMKFLDLACIGAAAINQGMKSLAVARERLARKSIDIIAQPWFSTITDDQDRERTRVMIRLTVVKRSWS
jgi:stage V sporulation protein SpoVS